MTSRYARLTLLVGLLLAPVATLAATDSLTSAYAAILRGDYDAGRATLDQALKQGGDAAARQVRDWLNSYDQIVSSRQTLQSQTFQWNIEQARAALAEDRPDRALGFVAQAAPYAEDLPSFGREPWVVDLATRVKVKARECEQAGHWSTALSYYVLLRQIYPDDDDLDDLREKAANHVRLGFLYKDKEALTKQIEGASLDILTKALRQIGNRYYETPDFKQAALGGLDNLITLCETPKLYKFLDGLANAQLRAHFVAGLRDLRAQVDRESKYDAQAIARLFNEVAKLSKGSVELPTGLLVLEYAEGIHQKLDDYTHVIWPADMGDFRKMLMGDFEGVGIQLGLDERSNRLKVVTPLENSPALEAGIQPDDLIIAVDGKTTKGWSTQDAVDNIMGPAGSKVVMTIFRPSTGTEIAFELQRRKIVLTTVRGWHRLPGDGNNWDFMLDKEAGVAYVRLTDFHPDSGREFRAALEEARTQGMRGLVLDIRHNAGGVLDVALDIVSNFIAQGEIVSTRGRTESDSRQVVRGRAAFQDVPVVVLVNEGSASASEILAGALQDHNRAVILGERTFGKGVVQNIVPLPNDAQLKVTIAHYYLPSGRTPQKKPHADLWGVEPDFKLKLTPKEFRRVLEQQRDSYIIHNESASANKPLPPEEQEKLLSALKSDDQDEEDEPQVLTDEDVKLLEADPHEAPATDPQLQTALLLLRVKLASNEPWPQELLAARQARAEIAGQAENVP